MEVPVINGPLAPDLVGFLTNPISSPDYQATGVVQ